MSKFRELFSGKKQIEEVFAPAPVVETVEVSAPSPVIETAEVSAPEAVSEEKDLFNPNARDGDGDGFVQDGTIYERPVSKRTKKD